jgi:HK97 family phage major capsid protein/HK97 family phage prohead protease
MNSNLMQRACTVLEVKRINQETREIDGIATTPTPDRQGDIVEPHGAEFKLPIPLLWQHDSRQPIGEVVSAKVTPEGIFVKARIAKIEDPGKLKDRVDEAWQSVKSGLVRGLSIGFKSLEDESIRGAGIRFIRWLWLELSAVTIPANADGSITAIKNADRITRTDAQTQRAPFVRISKSSVPVPSTNEYQEKAMSKGELSIQVAKSLLAALVHRVDAGTYAFGAWRNGAEVRDAIEKSAVDAISPTGTLVPNPASRDFAEFIRPQTIIGKLVGLRRAPARVRCSVVATGGGSAYWVGGGVGIKLSVAQMAGELFDFLKVGAISVFPKELVISTLPASESVISRDLGGAMVEAMDTSFIDPENAGVADQEPAAVTYDAPSRGSTGTDVSAIDADLGALIEDLSEAGSDLMFAQWVMPVRTAAYLARLRDSSGALAYPGISARGGTLMGFPVVTSRAYPNESGSPGPARSISLLDASQILIVDDGAGSFAVSDKVSVHMDDATTQKSTDTAAGTSVVSMFQVESVAMKAVRHVNWKVLRAGAAAQVLTGVFY